jgi:hypothetical protein
MLIYFTKPEYLKNAAMKNSLPGIVGRAGGKAG